MGLINEFYIQLYSVREELQRDFPGTLRKLGKIGYTGVEFAGYGGYSAKDLKKLLAENNLKPMGTHSRVEALLEHLDEEIEYNQILGTEYIILPHYGGVSDRDGILRMAELFLPAAEKITKAGMKFAYHNHAWEFAKYNGEYLLDIFYANTDPEIVLAELDLYWIAYAGADPLEYMKKYANRAKLLHIKQIKDYESKKCVDLNEGVIDFSEIIKTGKRSGVEYYILEQEEFEIDPFISVKNGIDFILGLED
ncbi:MAG: sugar phosphate isomerase/epimerase [Clostridiales bacterium]|jgi:sugar phosphate isomerase/epimerase|nr:sugar phosphate isomerase/epimerase [Clostridiales bacterium]